MDVTFTIDLPDGTTVAEAELNQNFDSLREQLLADDESFGQVLINDAARGVETALSDTLEVLVVRVCLNGVHDLIDGKEVVIDNYTDPGQLRLTPEGDDVVLSGDDLAPARYPRAELIPALLACGERYAAFLRRLRGDDPNWEIRLAMVEAAAYAARAHFTGEE